MSRSPVEFADTKKKARRFMDELYKEAYLNRLDTAMDTEFDFKTNQIALMSYSWGPGIRRVVQGDLVLPHFGDWLVDDQSKIVYQNLKADKEVMEEAGIDVVPSFYADIMITGWLHDETLMKHDLKTQSEHWLKDPDAPAKPWRRKPYQHLFAYVPEGKKTPIVMTPFQVLYDLPPDALRNALKTPGVKSKKIPPTTEPRTREQWLQLMLDYSGDDAESTVLNHHVHKKYLKRIGYWKNYLAIDRPYTLTLLAQSDRGVLLDIPRLKVILRKMDVKIMRAERVFRALAGNPKLNLRSGPQMQELLINEWGWPVRDDFKTATGAAKLNKEAMYWWSEEGYEMADVKLEFNNAATMKGTFLQGLINGVSDDGRLRSDFNQIGARTGRISSRKGVEEVEEEYTLKNGVTKTRTKKVKVGANLQNIPSRKEKDPDGIRGAFIAPKAGQITAWGDVADEDHVLIVCDFSGFELCMAIHWASSLVKDSPMLKVMHKYGSPSACHAFTAINLYAEHVHRCDSSCYEVDKKTKLVVMGADGKPVFKKFHADGQKIKLGKIKMDDWKMVKALFPDQYLISKNNNFNLLYGGSPKMMARLRGLDFRDEAVLDECREQAQAWNDLYQEIPIYQRFMVDHGYEEGWVPVLGGWHANVANGLAGKDSNGKFVSDEDKRKRLIAHWERVCMNTPCQGSASWIVKMAQILCERDQRLREMRCAQLFPVHDELVFEVPKRFAQECLPIVIGNMKKPFAPGSSGKKHPKPHEELAFLMDVEGMIGENWLQAKG